MDYLILKLETEIRYHKERIKEMDSIVSRETKSKNPDGQKLWSAVTHLAWEKASLEVKQREKINLLKLIEN